ncbi:MAG TPA: hypothetical protein VF034_00820 [Gemmatimonadaceae bacterium]
MAGVASGATLRPLAAQQSASQLVIFRVLPASQASVAPVPRPMSLAGARDESHVSWSIATNQPDRKIVASLDRPLSGGGALVVTLAAPAGATSAGPVVLDTAATDVVTGIPAITQSELPLHYRMNSDGTGSRPAADAQVVTVTYTVVEAP